jgi:hypothetical protein
MDGWGEGGRRKPKTWDTHICPDSSKDDKKPTARLLPDFPVATFRFDSRPGTNKKFRLQSHCTCHLGAMEKAEAVTCN